MSLWILIPFQMLLPKFARRLYLLLLLRPPLLQRLLPLLKSPAAAEASTEFTKELELTIQTEEDPTEHAPLVEVREVVPEDQAPSPSLAAFNKSFGTSHRGKLLSVGFETTGVGSKMSKILTLWKSSIIVDETGGESSEQPEGAAQDSEKEPHPTSETTPSSWGKASSGLAKQVTMQHFSKQGSFLFITFYAFSDSRISN
jgi:hypothetical protein